MFGAIGLADAVTVLALDVGFICPLDSSALSWSLTLPIKQQQR
jgi:hypothetical protein